MHKLAKSLLIAFIALSAHSASASILVGNAPDNDDKKDFTILNGLITAYNDDGKDNEPLPMINGYIDRLDGVGSGGAKFEEGVLKLSDFNLFERVGSGGTRSIAIFNDPTVLFDSAPPSAGNPVFGFEQLSGPIAQYYVSKNGNGFSLWYAMNGLNPSYRDSGSTDNRGNILNTALAFAPLNNNVSHISFYSTGESPGVPEPSTFAVFALGGIGIIAGGIRRRRK